MSKVGNDAAVIGRGEQGELQNATEHDADALSFLVVDSALASNKRDDAEDALSFSVEEFEATSKRKSVDGVDGGQAHKVIKTGEAKKSSNVSAIKYVQHICYHSLVSNSLFNFPFSRVLLMQ